jgi:hypothetical protein
VDNALRASPQTTLGSGFRPAQGTQLMWPGYQAARRRSLNPHGRAQPREDWAASPPARVRGPNPTDAARLRYCFEQLGARSTLCQEHHGHHAPIEGDEQNRNCRKTVLAVQKREPERSSMALAVSDPGPTLPPRRPEQAQQQAHRQEAAAQEHQAPMGIQPSSTSPPGNRW